MKKADAKSTAKTVAPKVAAKKSATKPVDAPKKTVAAKKPAVKPVEKAVKAPKVAKAAPAKAKAKTKAAPLATTISAAIDVGFGNSLTLRGEGPGLSWEAGVPMECAEDSRWTITLPATTQPIVCKFLINDATWSSGEDYTVLPGSSVVLSPTF